MNYFLTVPTRGIIVFKGGDDDVRTFTSLQQL